MFSKTSTVTAETVPGEERRRGKIQVPPPKAGMELVGQTVSSVRRNWSQPRKGLLCWCWAGEAALTSAIAAGLAGLLLKRLPTGNPMDARVLFRIL